jgi:transcriptional antiterminator
VFANSKSVFVVLHLINAENIKGDKSVGNLLLIMKSGSGIISSLDYSLIRCNGHKKITSNIILMKLYYVYDKHLYVHHFLFER